MRRPDLHPGGGHLQHLRTVGDHHAPATGGATIRYTTDGSTPSATAGTVYSSAVSITATTTLQAIAYETGYADSAVASGVYTIQCATPTFTPAAGHLWRRAVGDHQHHHRWGDHPLYHRRQHAESTVGTVYSSAVSITATYHAAGHRL